MPPIDDLGGVNHQKFLCEQKIIKIMDTPKIIDARLYKPEISTKPRILDEKWQKIVFFEQKFLVHHDFGGRGPQIFLSEISTQQNERKTFSRRAAL